MRYKYPRTPHLPGSNGRTEDDISFFGNFKGKKVVITQKMDGENTTMYRDAIHARSIDGVHHPSRDWVKNFHSQISHWFDEDLRICGENLYAKHSIAYDNLNSYFLGFSAWRGETCLDWNETKEIFEYIGIECVPELYVGTFDQKIVDNLIKNMDTNKSEGFVIRLFDAFEMNDFSISCAKYVRENHVQTSEHWKNMKIIPNTLKN